MDIAIFESLNGGEISVNGNDLATVGDVENQIYLALFGGNPGFPSKNNVDQAESFDWWGNNLLMPSNQSIQFNSLFEKELQNVALTSSGRIRLETAAKKDLEYLKAYAKVEVSITIVSDDVIRMSLTMKINDQSTKVKIVNFKKQIDGDFVMEDFNDDFFVGL